MGGGRKRRKQQATSNNGWQPPVEAVSRIVALHPSGNYAVVAVGDNLRGYNTRTQETFEVGNDSKAIARVTAFSPCGRWLLVGGDDKCCKLWKVDSWDACMNSFKTQKKVSAGGFTPDGNFCIAADKFGDVYCGAIDSENATPASSLLLGHYCSIVTSISVPSDGKTIVTTDRDNKVRVSVWPDNPSNGAFEIQSYCMGHSSFVTSSCFAHWPGYGDTLVTAGGDGRVLLWNHTEGKLLSSFQVPSSEADGLPLGQGGPETRPEMSDDAAGHPLTIPEECEVEAGGDGDELGSEGTSESSEPDKDGEEEVGSPSQPSNKVQPASEGNVVLSVTAATESPHLAVAVEGQDEVLILECDPINWKVSLKQTLSFASVDRPCFVDFDNAGRLWVAGGPVVTESEEIHLGLAEKTDSGQYFSVIQDEIPAAALEFLECRSKGAVQNAASTKAAPLSQTLGKKGYREVEFRKRYRADVREKEILEQRSQAKLDGGGGST